MSDDAPNSESMRKRALAGTQQGATVVDVVETLHEKIKNDPGQVMESIEHFCPSVRLFGLAPEGVPTAEVHCYLAPGHEGDHHGMFRLNGADVSWENSNVHAPACTGQHEFGRCVIADPVRGAKA